MARGRSTRGYTTRGQGRRGSFGGYRRPPWRGGRGRGRGGRVQEDTGPVRENDGTQLSERFERVTLGDEVDEKLGFTRVQEGERREGWLINMHPVRLLPIISTTTNRPPDTDQRSGLPLGECSGRLLFHSR